MIATGRNVDPEAEARAAKRYRLSSARRESIRLAQDRLCPICDQYLGRGVVDHDHDTGEVRGLLCPGCNSGLGLLGDNIKGLARASRYLTDPPARRVPEPAEEVPCALDYELTANRPLRRRADGHQTGWVGRPGDGARWVAAALARQGAR